MPRVFVALIVAALGLAQAAAAQEKPKPIRVLLVLGGCCHDYEAQKDILSKGITERANVEVTIALGPEKDNKHLIPIYAKDDWAKGYDVVVHDECTSQVTDMTAIARILKPHKEGLPGVVLHCAMHSYRTEGWNDNDAAPTPWFEFTGLPSSGHGPKLPIALKFIDTASAITKGMQNWATVNEELYNNYRGGLLDTAKSLVRGTQVVKGQPVETIVAWTNTYNGKTKVFGTTIGHNNETVADPRYLDLVTRGLLWATGHLSEDGKPAAGYEAKK